MKRFIIVTIVAAAPAFAQLRANSHGDQGMFGYQWARNTSEVRNKKNNNIMKKHLTSVPPPRHVPSPVLKPTRVPNVTGKPTASLTPREVLNAVRTEIIAIINSNEAMGPKFVRLGFHDCVGGCDGCVDLLNPDNAGLDLPINALESIATRFCVSGITRADIWSYAALTAADQAQDQQGVAFPFKWYGRPTCEMQKYVDPCQDSICTATRGPHRILPSSNLDTHGLLDYFDTTFKMTADEVVALLGAHSLGKVARTNSGFNGTGWDTTPAILNNAYYIGIVGAGTNRTEQYLKAPGWRRQHNNNSDLVGIPNRNQWSRNTTIMLNADISLVRDLSGGRMDAEGNVSCSFTGATACPIAELTFDKMVVYRNDNKLWLEDFSDVLIYMLGYPYDTRTGTCDQDMCSITTLNKLN